MNFVQFEVSFLLGLVGVASASMALTQFNQSPQAPQSVEYSALLSNEKPEEARGDSLAYDWSPQNTVFQVGPAAVQSQGSVPGHSRIHQTVNPQSSQSRAVMDALPYLIRTLLLGGGEEEFAHSENSAAKSGSLSGNAAAAAIPSNLMGNSPQLLIAAPQQHRQQQQQMQVLQSGASPQKESSAPFFISQKRAQMHQRVNRDNMQHYLSLG